MAATDEIIRIALEIKPELVTLVPEKRKELTTESGLDVAAQKNVLADVVTTFQKNKIAVSLFVDPERAQVEASKEVGAEMIEIHTGEYADAKSDRERNSHLVKIQEMARLGKRLGLGVNGGHGLNYANVAAIAAIDEIDELSIGHAIISRAVFVGIEQAVTEMLKLVRR